MLTTDDIMDDACDREPPDESRSLDDDQHPHPGRHLMSNDVDTDLIATMPINKLAVLRAVARDAIAARDAIDDFFSQAWVAAHKEAIRACAAANAEMERLAGNPKTRYGNWRTLFDVELMVLGYI